MANESRADVYRYPVDEVASDITPLASLEVFLGNTKVKVLNISMGGLAFMLEKLPDFGVGDPLDISVSVRGRAFPIQLELKDVKGMRVSASFLNPPPAFLMALKEFFGPKFLGASLKEIPSHRNLAAALSLVPKAETYEAFTAPNQSGVFLWMGPSRNLLQLVAVSRELVMGWDPLNGSRTGRLNAQADLQDVAWDRVLEITVFNYMADILLAWKSKASDREWMEQLFEIPPNTEASRSVFVPQ